MNDGRGRRVLSPGRRCAAWLCSVLPCLGHAAQGNLLAIERYATPGIAAYGPALAVDRAGPFGVAPDGARLKPGAGGIEQTEQLNFVVPELVHEGTRPAVRIDGRTSSVSKATAPDERQLWTLLKENRLAGYDGRLAEFTRDFPSWKPSQALVEERVRRQREQDVEAALNGGPAGLRSLLARSPDEFGCTHIDRAWKAADVFSRAAEQDAIYTLYRSLIPDCTPDANRIATLYRAERQLAADRVDELVAIEEKQGRRTPDVEAQFRRLLYQRALAALGAMPAGAAETASQLDDIAPAIRRYRDGPAATQAGWIEFAQHRLDASADWFATALSFAPDCADAAIGLAQVRVAQHDLDTADTLLRQPLLAGEPRARELRAQIALGRANDAYVDHRYADTLLELDRAAAEGASPASVNALRGWALYASGRNDEAEQVFRASYEQNHDDDSAEGLVLSMSASGARGAPVDSGASPLRAYELALDAQQLYYRKQFLAANTTMHDALVEPANTQRIRHYVPADLTGIDAPSVSAGLDWATHMGVSGQGALKMLAPTIRGEWINGTRQYELRYRQLFLDNDATAVHSEELQAMMADSVRIGEADALDWRASMGATQGPSTALALNGQASLGQETTWGAWSAYAGVSPVRDSLLSWRGTVSADGSEKWGAVHRAVNGVRSRWQVSPRWNVSAGAEAQWLTGMNVAGNEGVSADLSAGYDFRVPGFDYLSAGPALHYLAYRRNENFYEQGQGGYYSPQSSTSAGIALQMLSGEGRRFQWQGSFEAGWNTSYQADEPCFPLGLPDGVTAQSTCHGGRDRGPYGHAQVSAVVRLTPRWQTGALLDVNVTPGRDRQVAGLAFVRYFLEPHGEVFSRDLPRNARDFYLQLDDPD